MRQDAVYQHEDVLLERDLEHTGLDRRFTRHWVRGFSCDVNAGGRLVEARVENVSEKGFRLSHIDPPLQLSDYLYRVVIAGDENYYKMLAKPCWQTRSDKDLEAGFKILDVGWEWQEMIEKAETATR